MAAVKCYPFRSLFVPAQEQTLDVHDYDLRVHDALAAEAPASGGNSRLNISTSKASTVKTEGIQICGCSSGLCE